MMKCLENSRFARPRPTASGLAMNSAGTGSGALERVRVSGGWRMWKLSPCRAYSSLRHLASDSIAPWWRHRP